MANYDDLITKIESLTVVELAELVAGRDLVEGLVRLGLHVLVAGTRGHVAILSWGVERGAPPSDASTRRAAWPSGYGISGL